MKTPKVTKLEYIETDTFGEMGVKAMTNVGFEIFDDGTGGGMQAINRAKTKLSKTKLRTELLKLSDEPTEEALQDYLNELVTDYENEEKGGE